MAINMGDKNYRMTLRLNEKQKAWLVLMSETTGQTPSDYLRMMINTSMYQWTRMQEKADGIIDEAIKELKERKASSSNENDKTDFNDKL